MEIELRSTRISSIFYKQWLESDFCNWHIYKTPAGFSKTNNPLVQYNCRIKDDFTKRLKHHLKSSIKIFNEIISYESVNSKKIAKIFPKITHQ